MAAAYGGLRRVVWGEGIGVGVGVGVKACVRGHTHMQNTIRVDTCLHVASPCSLKERTFRHSIYLHRVGMIVIAP